MNPSYIDRFKAAEILLALDNEYKKCRKCGKYMHMRKNVDFINKYFSKDIPLDNCTLSCFVCFFHNMILLGTIPPDEIIRVEEIYANLYTVKMDRNGHVDRIAVSVKTNE